MHKVVAFKWPQLKKLYPEAKRSICVYLIKSKTTQLNLMKISEIVLRGIRKGYRVSSLNHVKNIPSAKSNPRLAVARL